MEHTELPSIVSTRLEVQVALPRGLSKIHKLFIVQRLWSELLYLDEGLSEVEVVAEDYLVVKLHIDTGAELIDPSLMTEGVLSVVAAQLTFDALIEVVEFAESMQEDKEDHHG